MKKNIFQGKWEQLKGMIQKTRGRLMQDDLTVIQGVNKILVGKIQEEYGLTKEEAENKVREYEL